jgi:homoserine O-succinyltransferase
MPPTRPEPRPALAEAASPAAEVNGPAPDGVGEYPLGPRRRVRVGLVNNMPDHALRPTEQRFEGLLIGSAPWLKIELPLYSLETISRTDSAMRYIRSFYHSLNELRAAPPDALIVTGAEPCTANLADEPYWEELGDLLDWADAAGVPTVLSCLAAHAGALHFDGVARRHLDEKCCGVFKHRAISEHPLMDGMPEEFSAPHSRFNGVDEEELRARGYEVLAVSDQAGVHLFAKQRRALFVFLQGHPEYETFALLRDYHREIRRFVRGEQEFYPVMPRGYFNSRTRRKLQSFRSKAIARRSEAVMPSFPLVATENLEKRWTTPGTILFRNWLEHVWQARGLDARETGGVAG